MLTAQNEETTKKRGFTALAYVVVAGGFITQLLRLVGQRGFGIALTDIKDTLGVSAAEVGLIASWYGAMSALGAIVWGYISDRIGPRYTMTLAGLFFTVGALSFGFIGSTGLIVAIATWTLAGFGASGLYTATVPKLISAWFVPEKRGHAMRFITPGGAIASMILGVVMPIGLVNFGWGTTFIIIGFFALICTAFFFFLINDDPYNKNLVPVGSPAGTQPAPAIKQDRTNVKDAYLAAMKLGIVWKIGLMYIAYQFFWQANGTFYVANIRGIGFSAVESGLAVSIGSIASIISMQVWGPLSDRIGRRNTLLVSFCGVAIMSLVLFFVSQSGPSIILMYALLCIMNFCYSTAPVILAMFSDYFPKEINSTCNGVVSTLSAVGYYLAPWIGGMFIDSGASYSFYLVVLIGVVLAFILTAILPKSQYEIDRKAKASKV